MQNALLLSKVPMFHPDSSPVLCGMFSFKRSSSSRDILLSLSEPSGCRTHFLFGSSRPWPALRAGGVQHRCRGRPASALRGLPVLLCMPNQACAKNAVRLPVIKKFLELEDASLDPLTSGRGRLLLIQLYKLGTYAFKDMVWALSYVMLGYQGNWGDRKIKGEHNPRPPSRTRGKAALGCVRLW